MVNKTRLVIGIIIWIGLTIFVTNRFATRGGNSTDHVSADLVKFSFLPRRDYQLDCDSFQVIRIGDPIYRRDERGRLVQIGEIAQVDSPDSKIYAPVFTDWARATFYASAPKLKQGDYLAYHETPASMDWVIRFMLPPEKQKEIAGMIAEVYAEHSSEILEEFLPVVQRAISEASVVVREDLVAAINKRHQQWSEVGDRFRIEVVEQEIIPLVNNEIWPIVQKHSRPLLEKVGEEIWRRASIWRFGWRAIYDSTPLPRRDLTQQEFARFVESDAIPVLENYLDEFVEVQQKVLTDVAENARVQEVITQSLKHVVNDQELQNLVLDILREVFIENVRLRDTLENIWNSEEAQQLMRLTDARLEPTVLAIGESLFGSPKGGVTSEFARILRHKILLKDARWFVLCNDQAQQFQLADDPGVITVLDGASDMDNPFYYPARDR